MTDGFTFFPNYAEAVIDLSDKQRLEFYDSLVKIGIYGQEVEPKDRTVRALISLIIPTLTKSVSRMTAGKNGGAKVKKETVCLTSKTDE